MRARGEGGEGRGRGPPQEGNRRVQPQARLERGRGHRTEHPSGGGDGEQQAESGWRGASSGQRGDEGEGRGREGALEPRCREQGGAQEAFVPDEGEPEQQAGAVAVLLGRPGGRAQGRSQGGGQDGADQERDQVGGQRERGVDPVEDTSDWLPDEGDGVTASVVQRERGGELRGRHDVAKGHGVGHLADHRSHSVDRGHHEQLPQGQAAGHHRGHERGRRDHPDDVAADQQRPQPHAVHHHAGRQPRHGRHPEGDQPDETGLARRTGDAQREQRVSEQSDPRAEAGDGATAPEPDEVGVPRQTRSRDGAGAAPHRHPPFLYGMYRTTVAA